MFLNPSFVFEREYFPQSTSMRVMFAQIISPQTAL